MAKRKGVSQTLRFEVFKRDLFTCQYCGKKAPEVVLEVDHIRPVSKGGSDAIENLVSACKECNRGKGARKLSDLSEVEKSRQQLEELQEKKNMVDLICQWKEEFDGLNDYMVDRVLERFFSQAQVEGMEATLPFRRKVSAAIKKIGIEFFLEAADIAVEQYVHVGDKNTVNNGLAKLVGIATNLHRYSLNPIEKKKSHTYYKAKRKFSGYPRAKEFFNHKVFEYIDESNYSEIIDCLNDADNWDDFFDGLSTVQAFAEMSDEEKIELRRVINGQRHEA